jgi:hypothetical protein
MEASSRLILRTASQACTNLYPYFFERGAFGHLDVDL